MRQLKISKQFTNRENKSLDKYLNEISKVSMIDAQEEVELARRIREGDQAALEKLVNANLRFVVSVSKQYQNQGLTLGDLINEDHTLLFQGCDHVLVMDDLLAHIDRSAIKLESLLHSHDCAIHTRAKTSRFGQQHLLYSERRHQSTPITSTSKVTGCPARG